MDGNDGNVELSRTERIERMDEVEMNYIPNPMNNDIESGMCLIDETNNSVNCKQCTLTEKGREWIKGIINYHVHLTAYVIFMIMFFFHFVVKYEKQLVDSIIHNFNKVIKVLINELEKQGFVLSQEQRDMIVAICDNVVEKTINKGNAILYNNSLYFIFCLLGMLFVLISIETKFFTQSSTFPKAFMKSVLLMIGFGLFEYCFFTLVIVNYEIVDIPSEMCGLYEEYL